MDQSTLRMSVSRSQSDFNFHLGFFNICAEFIRPSSSELGKKCEPLQRVRQDREFGDSNCPSRSRLCWQASEEARQSPFALFYNHHSLRSFTFQILNQNGKQRLPKNISDSIRQYPALTRVNKMSGDALCCCGHRRRRRAFFKNIWKFDRSAWHST